MKSLFTLNILLFLFTTLHSQVTISSESVTEGLEVGKAILNLVDTSHGIVDLGSIGDSILLDFSDKKADFEFESTGVNPEDSLFAQEFSIATYATLSNPLFAGIATELWSYYFYSNQSGEKKLLDLGFHSKATDGGVTYESTTVSDPPDTLLKFPMNYQDIFFSTGTRHVSTVVDGIPAQSYDIDFNTNRTVDAYGTLIMPDGREESVLRMRVESETTTYFGGFPQLQTSVSYQFYSPSGSFLALNLVNQNAPDTGMVEVSEITWHYGSNSTYLEENEKLANDYYLAQNYPNPFNPTTTIQYSIPKTSYVTLKVYDILGKEVETLVDKEINPGVYNSRFDGTKLSSGIYFYTLKSGSYTETKKFMLLK